VAPLRLRGHRVVLVDEATEHIVTMDVERRGNSGHPAVEDGPTDVDASVGALLAVVAGVLPEDSFEVPFTQDEHPVEAFGPHRPHPALGVSIWPEEIGLAS
jgi:hypothetical protein